MIFLDNPFVATKATPLNYAPNPAQLIHRTLLTISTEDLGSTLKLSHQPQHYQQQLSHMMFLENPMLDHLSSHSQMQHTMSLSNSHHFSTYSNNKTPT